MGQHDLHTSYLTPPIGYPHSPDWRGFMVSLHLLSGLAQSLKGELGQEDLVSFFMVIANLGGGKLGQADLINSSAEDHLSG